VLREWQEKVTEPNIALRAEIGDAATMNDMADLVGEARGKVYFDKFREQISTFIDRETALLNTRRAEFTTAQSQVHQNIKLMEATVGWVDHTNQVLATAAQILAHAVDMETGMRGYLLAGEEEFLAPYSGGRQAFFASVEALQQTVSDNPAAVARLGEARELIAQWVSQVAEPAIVLRRQVNDGARPMEAIDVFVSRQAGKKFFDAFRAEITAFSDAEAALLAERQATADVAAKAVHVDLGTMESNEEWVTHTYGVIQQADAILSAAVDMETGMRGYLLAGQDSFLAPYNAGAESFFDSIASLRDTVADNPAQVELLSATEQTIRDWQSDVTEPTIALRRQIGDARNMDDMADLIGEARGKQYFDAFRQIMAEFSAEEAGLMASRKANNEATVSRTFMLIAGLSLAALVVGLMLAWLIGNAISQPLRLISSVAALVAGGDKNAEVPFTERKDEIGDLSRSVLDIVQLLVAAQRTEAALDAAPVSTAMIDPEFNIIYANPALVETVRRSEDFWRERIPGFSANDLLGKSIDIFHKDPSMQRSRLASLRGRHEAEISFGGFDAKLNISPIDDDAGERLGYVLVWVDQTAERAFAAQTGQVISAARAGDFSARVEVSDDDVNRTAAADGINQLCANVEGFLQDVGQALGGLSRGDLTSTVKGSYEGQLDDIARNVDTTAKEIERLVGKIIHATGDINRASSEINTGATELSTRAESQAASLEETAAAMEEISATVKTNAENVVEANSLAEATRGQAEKGREVVSETVQAMADIRESATEISDIVATIEAIAFQTNLLALNAAVEAARAGDAGKGFAVVASEVRTLAQRSGDAAKTIKSLIAKSTDNVAAGDRLVADTDKALSEILTSVRNVASTIEAISEASTEQTTGVEEVSATVSQMDEITQQNASMADRSAAAARSLTEQSATLVDLVGFFKTEAGSGAGSGATGADHDRQIWEDDARDDADAARRPAPPAAHAANGNWAEF